jgi:DNA-binding transcriptional MerR regulator
LYDLHFPLPFSELEKRIVSVEHGPWSIDRMLICEFARKTGLTTDTVRFYVRLGLLTPETNGKGGRNPYQVFTADHVRAAEFIRMAKSLGLSLKEMAAIGKERQAGRLTPSSVLRSWARSSTSWRRKQGNRNDDALSTRQD